MTARDDAIRHIQAVRDAWWPTPIPAGTELDAIPIDVLRRVVDERLMVTVDIDRHYSGRQEPALPDDTWLPWQNIDDPETPYRETP